MAAQCVKPACVEDAQRAADESKARSSARAARLTASALELSRHLDQSERFAQRDVMSRAVRRLPDRQREVIVLRFYLDLSIAQTAAALGSSEGTVKSHTARALARMRELLGESHAGSSNVSAEVANAE